MMMHGEVFARMPSLGSSLMSSRGDAVELHKGMNRIANKLGLAKSAVLGPPEEKTWPPPGWPTIGPVVPANPVAGPAAVPSA